MPPTFRLLDFFPSISATKASAQLPHLGTPFPPSKLPASAPMADSAATEQPLEPPPPATPTSPAAAYHLHPRREPFEHGLLPIPKLIFSDGVQTLSQLKSALLSPDSDPRVNSNTLARVLQIPLEQSRLIIETIASVLHDESDPLLKAGVSTEIDEIGVNVFDLLIFLYIQSYKRLLPKGHRDSAAVADVWPSTSAFDGFLSALSPLQVIIVANFGLFFPRWLEMLDELFVKGIRRGTIATVFVHIFFEALLCVID